MSRSRRKVPITGIISAQSDHSWKKAAARKLRRRVKQELNAKLEIDRFPGKRWDLVNPWSSEKDGKTYWRNLDPRMMRQ